jgi:putative transposase
VPSDIREVKERVKLVEPDNKDITITRQCELLSITRNNYYYDISTVRKERDKIEMSLVLLQHSKTPFYGRGKISKALKGLGYDVSENQVRRLMKKAGIKALYPKPYLSCPNDQHKKYPYLLSGITVSYPNHVWATDITYIKIPGGHVYLMAILDLYSRKVLSWEISNTMDTFFCIRVVKAAIKSK